MKIPSMDGLTLEIQKYLQECDELQAAEFLSDCDIENYFRDMVSGNNEGYERELFDITVFVPVRKYRALGPKTEHIQSAIQSAVSEYAYSSGRLINRFEWQPYLPKHISSSKKTSANVNWVQIFNRFFELINTQGDTYYSGPRFLDAVREVNYNVPNYSVFIEQRRAENKSQSRKDYYYDVLMAEPEGDRIQIVNSILDNVGHHQPERTALIRQLLAQHQPAQAPQVQIPETLWNAERLTEYLERMDQSITDRNYELTLTLAYTCLEGFFKSFIRENIPTQIGLTELTPMAVQIRSYIKAQLDANGIAYPDQVLPLVSTVTNAVCNARNSFSDSHSGNRAEKWVAVYLRDNVNAIVKMVLNFI